MTVMPSATWNTWLKSVGTTPEPLPDEWGNALDGRPDVGVNIGYPTRRKPRVKVGDRLVYYGTGHGRLFAVAVVTDEPYLTQPGDEHYDPKFAWRTPVRILRCVPRISDGPKLTELSVQRNMNLVVRQQSHVTLLPAEIQRVNTLFGTVLATN